MLSEVLQKSTCAECKFCCSFRRCSLWETPTFPADKVQKWPDVAFFDETVNGVQCKRMDLRGKYKTDDPEEEAPCAFLDPKTGCTLSDEDKPFDCKIWPLRVMNKNGELVIALTPTCPAINAQGTERIGRLVREKIGTQILEYARENPYMIKEYREGFSTFQ